MTTLLDVAHVARSYSRRVVLRDVTFSARAGEVVGIVGPNGAGKTTLLRIVAGLQRADRGTIYLGGRAVPGALESTRVVYFGGERTMPLALRARTWQRLFTNAGTSTRTEPIGVLSRGTRQILGLETVFAIEAPHLILLDEPWEGLDPDAARWLTGALTDARNRGAVILTSSHRLHDLATVCDTCLFLDRGVVIAVDAREMRSGDRLTGELIVAAFDAVRRKAI